MLRCSKAWVNNHVAEALDALSEIFLQAGLLREDRPDRRQIQVTTRSIPRDVAAAYGSQSSATVTGRLSRKPALHAHHLSADRRQQMPA